MNTFFEFFRLVGDILVCCGFLSYSGPFNQDFRIMLNKNWMKELKNRKIPLSANLNAVDMLVNPATVAEWNLEGTKKILKFIE